MTAWVWLGWFLMGSGVVFWTAVAAACLLARCQHEWELVAQVRSRKVEGDDQVISNRADGLLVCRSCGAAKTVNNYPLPLGDGLESLRTHDIRKPDRKAKRLLARYDNDND